MNKKSLWKLILILAIPCIIGFMPAPAGLSELAWVLFGIYLAAIVGLVIKPFPEPVVLLIAVAASMVVVGNLSDGAFKTTAVLSGYSSGTTWLVFSAFTLSAAFVTTGLGKLIAYLLIGKIGNTMLGLGYVTVFLDLVLAPATPSNTARAGGIVLPIINSVAVALGSEPEKSPRRVGHYLMMSIYMVTKTTSYMFFTAMAGNILALKMINDILHLQISWGGWALAAGLPGIIMLLVTPLVIYTMYPPEIKKVDNKTIAKAGLAELGPMKIREKMLLGVFVLALLGWIFSKSLGVDESTVAIVVMATMLLLGIVTWEDVVKNKGGWNTLIWYGGIIGLSSLLSKVKFFEWLAEVFKNNLAFDGHGNVAFFVILFCEHYSPLFLCLWQRLYCGNDAYCHAGERFWCTADVNCIGITLFLNSTAVWLPVMAAPRDRLFLALDISFIKSWWLVGAMLTFLTFLVHLRWVFGGGIC
ncbi:anion permease [Shigella flexneri]